MSANPELDRMWSDYLARNPDAYGLTSIRKRSDVYRDRIEKPAERIAKRDGIGLEQAVDRLLREQPELYDEYVGAYPDHDPAA